MFINCDWWRPPPVTKITINEYQLYDVSKISNENRIKRRFLCKSVYKFYQDEDEDRIQKVQLAIYDAGGILCLLKVFSQIDNINRRFYTTR